MAELSWFCRAQHTTTQISEFPLKFWLCKIIYMYVCVCVCPERITWNLSFVMLRNWNYEIFYLITNSQLYWIWNTFWFGTWENSTISCGFMSELVPYSILKAENVTQFFAFVKKQEHRIFRYDGNENLLIFSLAWLKKKALLIQYSPILFTVNKMSSKRGSKPLSSQSTIFLAPIFCFSIFKQCTVCVFLLVNFVKIDLKDFISFLRIKRKKFENWRKLQHD